MPAFARLLKVASLDELRSFAIVRAKIRLEVDRLEAAIGAEIARRKARGEWHSEAPTGASFRRPAVASKKHQRIISGVGWAHEDHCDP